MSLLFLLSSLGVVNGLLIGMFLIFRNQNKTTNVYLGGLLLALSLRIGKSVFYYFGDNVDFLILQIGLSACTFIGPFFYLYTKSIHRQMKRIERWDAVFLLILFLLAITVGIIYPYRKFPEIWNNYFVFGIYFIWAFFTLMGLYFTLKVLQPVILKPAKMSKSQQQLAIITIAVLFINLAYQMALYGLFTYIWGSLIFSFTLYIVIGKLLLTSRFFVHLGFDQPLGDSVEKLTRLNSLMNTQKPHTNQKLRLEDLAILAGLSKHTLSRLLNEEYKHGFAHYVKEFRVEEAKQLILTRNELSLEGIGFEAGFSSKSSFFEAFKKLTNVTPSEYRKANQVTV